MRVHEELTDLNKLKEREEKLLQRVENAEFKRETKISEIISNFARSSSFDPEKII